MPTEEPLFPDPFTVELVPHKGWDDKATIPCWIDHDIYDVFVHSESIAHRNPAKKLLVGTIGKHKGAGFCPSNEFNAFAFPHQRHIDQKVRELHGDASDKACANLPPHETLEDLIEIAKGGTPMPEEEEDKE